MSQPMKHANASTRVARGVLSAACLALAFLAPAVAADSGLKPFTATYDASYMGMHTTGTMTLVQSPGDRWTYSFTIDSPVASLAQTTVFKDDGGVLKPLSNSDSSTFLIKKNHKQATYDWGSGQARWSGDIKDDRKGPVALKPGDLDAMLLNLAIARDVAAGKPLDYRLVDDGKVLEVRLFVEDPGTFYEPWTATVRYRKVQGGPLDEQFCSENNQMVFDYGTPVAEKPDF